MKKCNLWLSMIAAANISATINSAESKPTTVSEKIAAFFTQKIVTFRNRPTIFNKKFNTTIRNHNFSTLLRPPLFVSGDIYELQKTINIKEVTSAGQILDHGTIRKIWEEEQDRQRKEEKQKRRKDPKFMSAEERAALLNGTYYRLNAHLDPFVEGNNAIFCPNNNIIFMGSRDCTYCYTDEK